MKITPNRTLPEYLYHWEKNTPNEIYLRQPFGDTFHDFTWKETGDQVRRIATYLKSLDLPPKSNIGLVSKNCAEWIIADLAIMVSGHVSVPFYPTLTAVQINQVLVHSECKYLFVGKLDDWSSMKEGIPGEVKCIAFPVYNPDPSHIQWLDILKTNEPMLEDFIPELDDLMTIIYTSGTTGNPKGVMIKFSSSPFVLYNTRDFTHLEITGARFFSYLPLCHIAERNIVEAGSLVSGGTVYFADTLETFNSNLQNASPTHFLAVPRIWTKFQLGILSKLPEKKLGILLKIPIVKELIKKKIRKGLGLDDAIITLTGAAPMPASLIKWFARFDIIIQDAYGMTENVGAVCMMPREKFTEGAVGKIYPGMEVKIDTDNGEILTRSSWNMIGYFKEPQMTAETIDKDGWIHTGDVGEVDNNQILSITGRVKEMYKTSKGEYVAPAQIEFHFADNNLIEQICVVGQSLPQPIALVVLSELAQRHDKAYLIQNLTESLKEINPTLKSYERIKKIVIMNEPWNVENNMLTPTFKIKRNIIEKTFAAKFENWYEAKEEILFL